MNIKILFPDGRIELSHICGESEDGSIIYSTFGTFVRPKNSWTHAYLPDPRVIGFKISAKEAREIYRNFNLRN